MRNWKRRKMKNKKEKNIINIAILLTIYMCRTIQSLITHGSNMTAFITAVSVLTHLIQVIKIMNLPSITMQVAKKDKTRILQPSQPNNGTLCLTNHAKIVLNLNTILGYLNNICPMIYSNACYSAQKMSYSNSARVNKPPY